MRGSPAANRDEAPPASFPALYREHVSMIRNVLFRLGGRADLDDLTQEVFVRVWKGLPGFLGEASLKTWIYAITARVAADRYRKRGVECETALEETRTASGSDEEGTHVRRDLVRRGLASLSFDHRLALVLHVMEGLSIDEAARIADTSVGTIKSRLHYARKAMAAFLEGQGVRV